MRSTELAGSLLLSVLLSVLLTGCDERFWQVLNGLVSPPPVVVVNDEALPFSLEQMNRVLDLETRYAIVQDRNTPQYHLAEWLSLDSTSACQNFAHEGTPTKRRMGHDALASEERAYAHYENPWLLGSAYVASLAVRQEHASNPNELKLLKHMLLRYLELSAEGGEFGYLLRYDGRVGGVFEEHQRCRFPNGYCTVLNKGPFERREINEGELWATNALQRRWEPSGDEYVGALVTIAFIERFVKDPELRALNQTLAERVAGYLRNHDYYLERPCPDKGSVWRGAYHIVFAHAYERVFERMGLGYVTPHFPTPVEYCERNQITMIPYNTLLPCTPLMVNDYNDELGFVLAATQVPGMQNLKAIYDAYIDGTQFPFLRLTGSGPNLIMFILAAESALFDDAKPRLAKFYRNFQQNSPERITAYWHGLFLFADTPLEARDEGIREQIRTNPACAGELLPLEDEGCGWSVSVTLPCVLPMTMMARRAGGGFGRAVSPDALPLRW